MFLVRRVHWLRARAQLMRWQEEVCLTNYEMQWTVRYFSHVSSKWNIHPITGTGTGTFIDTGNSTSTATATSTGTGTGTFIDQNQNLTAGALAYHKRKLSIWEDLTKKADLIFRQSNPAYQSPL
jgi:hypothetical protein